MLEGTIFHLRAADWQRVGLRLDLRAQQGCRESGPLCTMILTLIEYARTDGLEPDVPITVVRHGASAAVLREVVSEVSQ